MASDEELLAEWQNANSQPPNLSLPRSDQDILNEWQNAQPVGYGFEYFNSIANPRTESNPQGGYGITDAIMSGIPFTDEIGAAASTVGKKTLGELLDYVTGNNIVQGGWGDVYTQELAKRRGQEKLYFESNPITANAASLLGAATIPLGKIESLSQAIKTGSLLGGTYGFAGGEDGLINRAINAIEGAGIGGTTGGILHGASQVIGGLSKLIGGAPTEEQSLLQAFKVPEQKVEEVAPILEELKSQGIIKPTQASSNTPFQDIRQNLSQALMQSEGKVQSELSKLPSVTTKDILPSADSLVGDIVSGAEDSAINSVVKSEQKAIIKSAIQKGFPNSSRSDVDKIYNGYIKLGKLARSDSQAADAFQALKDQIENTTWTPNDIRNLRIKYDAGAKWNSATEGAKAQVYRDLRNNLQSKLIDMAGGNKSPLAQAFKDYAPQMAARKTIKKMAGAERKGTTQEPGLLNQLLNLSVKKPLSYLIPGIQPSKKAETALKQAFGQTASQKIESAMKGPIANLLTSGGVKISGLANSPTTKHNQNTLSTLLSENSKDSNILLNQKSKNIPMDTNDIKPIVEAVIKQESGGKADAISPVGAKGLMQLMDATGKELFKEAGLKGEYDPYNAEQNKKLGTLYLKKLLDKYGGDLKLALAAYNYGMGRIDKLLKQHNADSFESISSYLPTETRNYVPSVLNHLSKITTMEA